MMFDFEAKTYGRIFVEKAEDIEVVDSIIKVLDPFEWEYLPDDLIAVWDGNPMLVYGGKFEMNREKLALACWRSGVKILTLSGHPDCASLIRTPK